MSLSRLKSNRVNLGNSVRTESDAGARSVPIVGCGDWFTASRDGAQQHADNTPDVHRLFFVAPSRFRGSEEEPIARDRSAVVADVNRPALPVTVG
jgi:hypothetical protein